MPWFSLEEIRDIGIALLALILILVIKPPYVIDIAALPICTLAAIFGFLFHELAHKFVAIKFGAEAHFKLWFPGILGGLIFAPTGIKFLAPGAVFIYPYRFKRWASRKLRLTTREVGLVALAGPFINIIFALIFLMIPMLRTVGIINVWLALFNLIPVPPLDGEKVVRWNLSVWLILFILSLVLVFV